MASAVNELSAAKVAKISEPGVYGDGGGLYLQVSKWRTKSWLFRFMIDGRSRYMGLGSVATFGLAEAREKARACRQLLHEGIDPIEQRRSRRAAVAGQGRVADDLQGGGAALRRGAQGRLGRQARGPVDSVA